MPRILVVEDDDDVRTLIGDVLRAAKLDVDAAATVKSALPLFELNYYNLLLADLALPDGSVMQIAEEAWRRATPAIILTAYPHRFRRADLARFGLMLKPVRPAELIEAVNEVLKQ